MISWISIAITTIHTYDEVYTVPQVPIYRYLHVNVFERLWRGFGYNALAVGYFVFQLFVCYLAYVELWLPLIGVRSVDIIVTHMLLPWQPNPGKLTAPLLACDVAIIVAGITLC